MAANIKRKKGCGSRQTYGHGEVATCGEEWYGGEIYVCRGCLKEQRDELLAALEKARPFINAWPQCRDNSTPHIEGSGLLSIVDDAIARVKGGA